MVDRISALIADLDRWSRRHRVPRVARRASAGFMEHEGLQYAGSMAYFGVLSIFQLLVLGVVVFSLFLGEGEARDFVLEQVEAGSPLDPETIGGVIDAVIESRGEITIVSGAFLLWSALGVFGSLSTGIGRAFEATEPRPFVMDKLLGLLLMAITGVLAIASLLIGILTGIVQEIAGELLDAVPGGGAALGAIGLVVPFLLILMAFLVIYRLVPNRPVSFASVWPGAVVAALLWTVLRFGFTWYATSVARYDSAFGPISTGVTLLVFLYFASVIVLLGAEGARANVVDAELTRLVTAGPRGPIVPEVVAGPPAPVRRGGIPRWALVAAGAIVGIVAGRLTKRDDED
jgi:membrane protein